MTSNPRLFLTERASADLRAIRRYTAREWGIAQRDRYMAQLQKAIDSLISYPERGRPRNELFPGCRGLPVERHIIFYYLTDEQIVIERVLHGRQNASEQLPR